MFIIVIEGLSVLKKRKKNLRIRFYYNSRITDPIILKILDFLIIGIAIKNENFWIPRGYLFSFFFFFSYTYFQFSRFYRQ